MIVCRAGDKPLILLHLLLTPPAASASDAPAAAAATDSKHIPKTIVFTASIESTHRLYRLLEAYAQSTGAGAGTGTGSGGAALNDSTIKERLAVAEYSSALPQEIRTRIIDRFRTGSIRVIICSDAMARGMDLPHVDRVINYDAAPFIRTYIHRVGRTARAGRSGVAISLVRGPEVRHFKEMLWKAQNSKLQPYTPPTDKHLQPIIPRYTQALAALKTILDDEKSGALKPYRPLQLHKQFTASAAAAAAAAAATTGKTGKSGAATKSVVVAADTDSHVLVKLEEMIEPPVAVGGAASATDSAATHNSKTKSAPTAPAAKSNKTDSSSDSSSSSDSD